MLIVVRRGALERFETLRREFRSDEVSVIWDRRLGDRRQRGARPVGASERRRGERRAPAPASWHLLDFVVTPVARA